MTNKFKQTKDDLDAANHEIKQVMNENARLAEEVAHLRSDKMMLMWQMDIIRATVSRVVQP